MNQPKPVLNLRTFCNIHLLLGASVVFSLLLLLSPYTQWNVTEDWFAFSPVSLKSMRLWTLFTHGMANKTLPGFLISTSLIIYTSGKLKQFYSPFELGKFYLFSLLTGSVLQILLAPESLSVLGAIPVSLAFAILNARFYGQTLILNFRSLRVNFTALTLLLILATFIGAGTNGIPDTGSIPELMGIFLFCYFYIQKDSQRKTFYQTPPEYEPPPEFLKEPFPKYEKKDSPDSTPTEAVVNAILDKISEKGIHTLTQKERELLDKASKKRKN